MIVAVVAGFVGLVAVVVALARDRPLDLPAPSGPDWEGLPAPDDVTRVGFPLAVPGYDPAHVEAHLDAVRRAYEDVLDVLPPQVLERARFRAALRTGHEHVPAAEAALAVPAMPSPTQESDEEALRTVVALAHLADRR